MNSRCVVPSFDPRATLRKIPRAALVCALIASLNAACWSIVTPAFQAPDEPDHFAYVKQLAETGTLPPTGAGAYESNVEILTVLNDLRYFNVRQQPRNRTLSSQAEQNKLQEDIAALPTENLPKGSSGAGVATSEPPLYYALETIPYDFADNLLTRLQLMRLLSALMAGITALFAFLFVRESLPRVRWAWTIGGLAVALTPLLGFVSGSVNPDALLFAVSAAIFYTVARGFRRGFTPGLAAALGTITAIGLLTKLNFLGLMPGIVLAIAILTVRAARTSRRYALSSLAIACAIPACPVGLYGLINALSHHRALGLASNISASWHTSVLHEISYIWQSYFPRLPGMANDFPGLFTTRQFWFNGYVGLYGWLDTTFPGWVYSVALVFAAVIAALCLRGLAMSRAQLRPRVGELAVYTLMAVGVMALVGGSSYNEFPKVQAGFAEARYLLPMLPLLAAAIALAARGAGRRWGPAVGALIVILFLAHDIFSQLLVVARFYG